ncbi:HAD-IIIC family phosphatase [Kitasatospora aureofaciens]|uniref:HAD-IIIC family phosphatase n=1 Tax=Kitasatospora aureofaciens TaxID=1894 RepID=UPI001C44F23A|nr:HAD-IIIC family phosphatase [Kitasatospora aureofaciens]MBV6699867.1 HAD-IIIC family phosphatase [Kitasatospora aureofaciens]
MTEASTQPAAAQPAAALPWPELLGELRGEARPQLWRPAARRLRREPGARARHGRRQVALAVLATHTTDFLAEYLPVGALSVGIDLTVRQFPYGQVEAELLDPAGELRAQRPDYVLLAGTEQDLQLGAADPDAVVEAAVARWSGLWTRVREDLGARVVQCLFTVPADDVYGNVSAAVGSSDSAVVRRINAALLERGGDDVLFVDCDRLAADVGRRVWRDPRYWDALRQPVSLDALPLLARTVAGVLAADLGLTRRCLVVDLDNTLWGGVLGEDGLDGVQVGQGAVGEAHARFQEYLGGLRRRGVVLAVASKNDADLAHRALAEIPGMRLRPSDFAVVVADWRPKSEQLREIAGRLGLGLESLAFVDDNPAERSQVAGELPEVDVIALPAQPSQYVRALAGRPTLETGRPTADDRARAASYQALQKVEGLRVAADSLEGFLDSLQMRSLLRPLTPGGLDRAAQLLQKTNQFNLTTRRRSRDELAELLGHPDWRCLTLSLRDRFADHGTVGLVLLRLDGAAGEIDTLLLSCRVIGRTAERRLVAAAAAEARAVGCDRLVGRYVPTSRNSLVAGLYPELGFQPVDESAGGPAGARSYMYPLDLDGPSDSPHLTEEQA